MLLMLLLLLLMDNRLFQHVVMLERDKKRRAVNGTLDLYCKRPIIWITANCSGNIGCIYKFLCMLNRYWTGLTTEMDSFTV